ncbi:MAG: Bug family tripartite tricarboxylate transporter substrate binding protein [Beijerinckiaceae bacterium]|jgi:tripartite-type tricarboxylate transporter receptor subunit TctC
MGATGFACPRPVAAFLVLASFLVSFAPQTARSDDLADFYRGKRLIIYIGSSAGDGTDLYGRLVARHMSARLPGNPTFVASNAPGANGLVAANHLYNLAPRDGTALATFSRYAAFEALWKNPSARFEPERFNWIGNVNVDVSICLTWHTAGVKTLSDFMKRDLKIGVTNESHVNILNNLFGAQLHAIKGYPGGNEVNIALERGEVDGRCNISWSALTAARPNWVRDKQIDILIQFSHRKLTELPDTPLVTDLATTETQRQIINLILTSQMMARVIVAPPDTPQTRVDALRKAFDQAVTDPDFIADAQRLGAPVDPISGEEVQRVVAEMMKTPAEIVKQFQTIVGGRL